MINKIKSFIKYVIEIIYPNKCVICSKIIENQNTLCQDCWNKINFIQEPYCDKCSTPFEFSIQNKEICINCIQKKPLYKKMRCAVTYNENSAKIISNFKFKDKTYLKTFIAKCMLRASKDIINNINIFIPVPLHKKRLLYRKYNQSLFLCNELAKLTNKKVIYDFIIKKKHTSSQVKLKRKDRETNLKNAFEFNPKYKDEIEKYKKYNICIVDDVITTGTTINECVRALHKKNICNVYAMIFSKNIF